MDLPTAFSEEPNNSYNHGWQKVTNPKKTKRQETPSSARSKTKPIGSMLLSDTHIFQALEKETEQKRANRDALLNSLLQPHQQEHGDVSISSSVVGRSSDSDEEGEGEFRDGNSSVLLVDGEAQKKPKIKKPKKPKVTVAEAASSIDSSDFSSFLAQITESFGELPDVQLMRFADYFGRAFNQVTPTQFGWNKILKESSLVKAIDVPLCYINESIIKIANDWLAARPVNALAEFVLWGLNDIVNDMQPQQSPHKGSKGAVAPSSKTKIGILVVLALTLRKRPESLLHKADVLSTSPQFQGQDKLVMLAWAYGQVALGDLVVGMQVWVQNLLPLACGKASTPGSRDIALQLAESIIFSNLKKARPILQNGASRKGERLVPPVALYSLMQSTFPSDAARTKATERFGVIYPLVKELALAGPNRSKATRPVAQQLLPLCLDSACEEVPALVHEACDLFIWCLSQNNDCFKQWEKLHLEKLDGSIKVLSYICEEWKVVFGRLHPLDELKREIDILSAKNHKALERAKLDENLKSERMLLKVGEKHMKVLKRRLGGTGPCFKAMATLVAGVGIAYGCYLLKFDLSHLR